MIDFGGNPSPSRSIPRMPDLAALSPDRLEICFGAWLEHVWIPAHEVPVDASGLAMLDLELLKERFRKEFTGSVWQQMQRRSSLESGLLVTQITDRVPYVLIFSNRLPEQRLDRVTRKVKLPSETIVKLIHRYVREGQLPCHVFIWDGEVGHVILAEGVDEQTGWIRYYDPWPDQDPSARRSLLCAEHNAAGVDASADPDHARRWLVTATELAAVIAAIQLPESRWAAWQADWNMAMGRLLASGVPEAEAQDQALGGSLEELGRPR